MSNWKSVTKVQPCNYCGRKKYCRRATDGSVDICTKINNGIAETRYDKNGAVFHIYRLRSISKISEKQRGLYESSGLAPSENRDQIYRALLDCLSLNSNHQENLITRGLSDEEIKRRFYRSLPLKGRAKIAGALHDRFGDGIFEGIPGIIIKDSGNGPYLTLAGSPGMLVPIVQHNQIVGFKIRLDEVEDDDPSRYITFSSKSYSGTSPGSLVHIPLHENKNYDTLRLTEGELKSDIATALTGILTISIPGVNNWRLALPILQELGPKTVLLSLDADQDENEDVARALVSSYNELNSMGFIVEVEQWESE